MSIVLDDDASAWKKNQTIDIKPEGKKSSKMRHDWAKKGLYLLEYVMIMDAIWSYELPTSIQIVRNAIGSSIFICSVRNFKQLPLFSFARPKNSIPHTNTHTKKGIFFLHSDDTEKWIIKYIKRFTIERANVYVGILQPPLIKLAHFSSVTICMLNSNKY